MGNGEWGMGDGGWGMGMGPRFEAIAVAASPHPPSTIYPSSTPWPRLGTKKLRS
jgi:hypothetical protein